MYKNIPNAKKLSIEIGGLDAGGERNLLSGMGYFGRIFGAQQINGKFEPIFQGGLGKGGHTEPFLGAKSRFQFHPYPTLPNAKVFWSLEAAGVNLQKKTGRRADSALRPVRNSLTYCRIRVKLPSPTQSSQAESMIPKESSLP